MTFNIGCVPADPNTSVDTRTICLADSMTSCPHLKRFEMNIAHWSSLIRQWKKDALDQHLLHSSDRPLGLLPVERVVAIGGVLWGCAVEAQVRERGA